MGSALNNNLSIKLGTNNICLKLISKLNLLLFTGVIIKSFGFPSLIIIPFFLLTNECLNNMVSLFLFSLLFNFIAQNNAPAVANPLTQSAKLPTSSIKLICNTLLFFTIPNKNHLLNFQQMERAIYLKNWLTHQSAPHACFTSSADRI
ncbi:hypothetical protein [Listeria phage HB17054]|uniref:Uncharacterized protein n=1 Tax=Listeria phage HB17054 TaxID=2942418 RepID=A0A9E7S2F5_9CAUD|nr:hypothetical protein X845_2345 [Listeria monocytogenes Lm_1824]URQ02853.1 hypothetical protein [Listeria phage HB17054]